MKAQEIARTFCILLFAYVSAIIVIYATPYIAACFREGRGCIPRHFSYNGMYEQIALILTAAYVAILQFVPVSIMQLFNIYQRTVYWGWVILAWPITEYCIRASVGGPHNLESYVITGIPHFLFAMYYRWLNNTLLLKKYQFASEPPKN